MDDSAIIKLGSKEYTVYPCTIGELRKITKIFQGDAADVPYEVLGVAMKRASPPVEDIDSLVAPIDDIRAAVDAYLKLGGLAKADGNPPEGV